MPENLRLGVNTPSERTILDDCLRKGYYNHYLSVALTVVLKAIDYADSFSMVFYLKEKCYNKKILKMDFAEKQFPDNISTLTSDKKWREKT